MRLMRSLDQNGFTLLEVIVGLLIFTIGILGANALQLTSITGNTTSRTVTEASTDVASQIESMLLLDYNDPALIDDDDGLGDTDTDNDVDGGDGTDQDLNNDGVDDSGGDNFGLDDLTNPDGAADSDGDGTDDIFWNIAVDHPVPNTKTIKFFIDPPGRAGMIELTYIKPDII